MNINQFLNKGTNTNKGEKAQGFKDGVAAVGAKSLSTLGSIAKTVTPANIKMVERVEGESLDRDIELTGNVHVIRTRVNQIAELLGLDAIDAMTEEETVAYVAAFRESLAAGKSKQQEEAKAAKDQAKEAKKATKTGEEVEVKNSKLKAFFENFTVPKKDNNPVDAAAQVDSPYPDEDEATTALRQLEKRLLGQETPILIEVAVEEVVEVEEEKPKKPRRARTEKKGKKVEEVVEEPKPATTRKKVAVFDEPDGKYDFEGMA